MHPQRWLRWFLIVPLRWRSLSQGVQVDQELDEELQYHLDQKIDLFVAKGFSPEAARHAALRELGGLAQVKDECRDTRKVGAIESALQDLRHGARVLRNSPGFTILAALTLALGIGANTAMFSLVNGILLRPLPFPDADRLVRVTGAYPQGGLVALREQARTMEVASYAEGKDFNMTGWGDPVRLTGTLVSAEWFSVLRARPLMGRTLLPGEDAIGRDRVMILSHTLWQQRFASDPQIIGKSVLLDGVSRQIIGVMPPDFVFPSTTTELWLPLNIDPQRVSSYWAGDYMPVIARLRHNATLPEAHGEVQVMQSRLRTLFPWPMPESWNKDVTAVPLQRAMVGDIRTRLVLLLGAVTLILGIACANVANLLLARGTTRSKELAVRAALGAARVRLVRQLLMESLLLAGVGGVLGVGLAASGLRMLKSALPADTPRLAEVALDWRVLAFVAALVLIAGVAFGLVPALQASRTALASTLNSTARGSSSSGSPRLRSALVVGEVALAAMLVIASGILIRSFWMLSHVHPGFRSEGVQTLRVNPDETWCAATDRCLSFYRALLDRARELPGLGGVALINTLPLDGRVEKRAVNLLGAMAPLRQGGALFWMHVTSPEYFRVMNIPVLRGRTFTDADLPGSPPVAIVTAATARRFWPGDDAVGKQVRLVGQKDWHTIVGVIGDVRAFDLQRDEPQWIDGTMFVPYGPQAVLENGRVPIAMTLVARTALDDLSVSGMLRRAIADLNRDTSVSEVRTMTAVVSESVSTPRSTTALFGVFAGLGLALGMTGVYGVLSFFVSKRVREIGIRIALGAQRRDVLRLVLGEGAKYAGLGVAIGLAGAFALTRLMSSELYGVSPADPIVFATVASLLIAVTLLACYVPARRAMRVDPLIALRSE